MRISFDARRANRLGLALLVLLLLPLVSLGWSRPAQAEDFVAPPFQQQWAATDQAVANGQAQRTYFWGPSPFAHTNEVYAESPDGGQRRVQYFDKARMELSNLSPQTANYVTNGLLTVELVSGQMQVGDNTFLKRSPATNPVAGDQLNNPSTPTYASFNQGKLAFGVEGHVKAADRTGQTISEAVDKSGTVSTAVSLPTNLRYATYIPQTGHNIANVFYDFFQAAPLGSDKWLAVMGYPITEPFWSKEKVIVAGKPQAVLIQLFQRRALTYTPANPVGYQVEMGNIGQHYYVWRYGFNPQDELPGNYRLILPRANKLLSIAVRNPADQRTIGNAPAAIEDMAILPRQGRAVLSSGGKPYLADLTSSGALQPLARPDLVKDDPLKQFRIVAAPDGVHFALLIDTYTAGPDGKSDKQIHQVIQVYELANAPGSLEVLNSTTIEPNSHLALLFYDLSFSFSADGRYVAWVEFARYPYQDGLAAGQAKITVWDGKAKQSKMITIDKAGKTESGYLSPAYFRDSQLQWIGQSNQILLNVPGRLLKLDAASGSLQTLFEDATFFKASLSPDGNYFVAVFSQSPATNGRVGLVSLRSLANPGVGIGPALSYSAPDGSEPSLNEWSSDGNYFAYKYVLSGRGGYYNIHRDYISLANGKLLLNNDYNFHSNDTTYEALAAPFYRLQVVSPYDPYIQVDKSITLINFDGSDRRVLWAAKGSGLQDYALALAQVVQIPRL